MNRYWPAGELIARVSIGRIDQEAIRFHGLRFRFRIESDHTESATLFMSLFTAIRRHAHLRIASGVDLDLIPETIEVLTCIRQAMTRTIRMRHPNHVWLPPTRPAWGYRWRAKSPVTISLPFDSVLRQGPKVRIATNVQSHRGSHDRNGPIPGTRRPTTAIEVVLQVPVRTRLVGRTSLNS